MSTFNITYKLRSLGFHIGHRVQTVKNQKFLNKLIIGVRNSYHILNINVSVFFLKKALSFVWNVNLGHCHNIFYYSSRYTESSSLLVKSFLRYLVFFKTNSSFVHLKWTSGLITNYRVCFIRFIRIVSDYYPRRNHSNRLGSYRLLSNDFFMTFFLKLLFLLNEKKSLSLDVLLEFQKILPLAKVLIFLRFWKSFFTIPDVAYVINSDILNSPIHEFNSVKVPIVGTVDTANIIEDISYIIPLNDDSLIMVFFLFSIFSNVIRSSRMCFFYNTIR